MKISKRIKRKDSDVRNVLLNRLDHVFEAYNHFQNNPYDPKTTHQLRVNTRKLRGLLNFLKPVLGEEQYDAMNHPLRQMGRIYAPVRELDVLLEICGKVAISQPNLSEHYKELFEYLHKERQKKMNVTLQRRNTEQVEKTLSTIERILHEVAIELDKKQKWDEFTWKRLKKMNEKMQKERKQLDWADYQEVHKTRIRAKKVRYASRDFGNFTKKNTKKLAKQAEKTQGKLGKLTDLEVNIGLLHDYREKVNDEELKQLFSEIAAILEEEKSEWLKNV
jgi:CHAD domain-containing protein